ncbi:Golgi phosphoprotein 3-like B [Thelohanellus kitauei]|uniref:Golgi phosphoprotein 3-like B n=1 Tax=Thelohanellus kitauei TaxID=669202 RepID=A0A0C2IY42_THEKT|nr:Golgi phosphoprotein 3-like B [Thelohanellus kitauei]
MSGQERDYLSVYNIRPEKDVCYRTPYLPMSENLVQRKSARVRNSNENVRDGDDSPKDKHAFDDDDKFRSKRPNLTLMEELILLSSKDDTGETFLFNNSISLAMRACMLVELAIRGRIEMEPAGIRKKNSERRMLRVTNNSSTGEPLLDEALKLMSESTEADSVSGWLTLLTGETWNPTKLGYQMRNVRLKTCKGLVEKGICTASTQNMVIFSMTVYPIIDTAAKRSVINYFCDLLTKNWKGVESLSPRDFALLSICYAVETFDYPLSNLNDSELEMALGRLRQIGKIDSEEEINKLSSITDDSFRAESNIRQIIHACLVTLDSF